MGGTGRNRCLAIMLDEAFKGKHARIIENGNTIKLLNREGKVLFLYNITQDIQQEKVAVTKAEFEYISIFKNTIKTFKE